MATVATLAEFKAWLNYTGTADDTELTMVLNAGSLMYEALCSTYCAATSVTETQRIEGCLVQPRRHPLNSVTSITPDQGSAIDSSNYAVDTTLGLIRMRYRLCGRYTLVYSAGATPNDREKLGGLELCRHLWLTQNGSAGRGYPGDELVPTPAGFAVPRRVMELLQPDQPVMVA